MGDTNLPFYRALREAGATPRRLLVLSIVMAEAEMRFLRPAEMAGNYTAMSYFQSVGGSSNADFVRRFKRRFGAGSVISDPMESAYESVQLWAQAVRRAHNVEPPAVLHPVPYPPSRTRRDWNGMLHDLYTGWHDSSARPS